MGLHPWYLDLYVFMCIAMACIAGFFVLIGIMLVALEGRKAWTPELTTAIVMIVLFGALFPLIVLFPFVALYRAVTNK